MGAQTALLIHADGEVPGLLRQVEAADLSRTSEMMRRLYPGWEINQVAGSSLGGGAYPPKDTAYAASRPGVEIVCDRRVMIDFPWARTRPWAGVLRTCADRPRPACRGERMGPLVAFD
ncbi:DUF6928 family protein [Streptomyces sp. NPDC005122]